MSVARRASVAFGVVFLISIAASAAVYVLAAGSSSRLSEYRTRTATLADAMAGVRADFYNYDDQMNMYVAVLAGGGQGDLAETTYQQAVDARADLVTKLDLAQSLAPDGDIKDLLARVRTDFVAYNGFADQTRAAAKAGDVKKALYLSTVGNLEPSNDLMPTLDAASDKVTAIVATELGMLDRKQSELKLVSVASAAVVALMIGLLALGTRLLVLRRLSDLRDRMDEIANRESLAQLTERVPVRGNDEIAQVASAFNTVLDALHTKEVEVAEATAERERNLSRGYEQQRQAEQQVRMRAREIIDTTAESVAGELAELSSQVEVVRGAARTIDDRVGVTDRVTREVVERARQADAVVSDLLESLRQVSGMANLIAGVADQTKLLALNATIEAARAGESGRGFSVVANEVKDLAMTTARSTTEISTTIATVEAQTSAMAEAIAGMSQSITGVDDATGVLREVARQQFEVVGQLEERVSETVARIEAMSMLTQRLERRQHRRVAVGGTVRLKINGELHEGRLADIGEGGIRVTMADGTFYSGQTGEVEFTIADRAVVLSANVVARRIGGEGNDVGLQFLDPQPNLTEEIRDLVNSRADDAVG